MEVPTRIYASYGMMSTILADKAIEQAVNVAHMPGIVGASLAMPDIHWGYGFPIGGVAAFDADRGVISPGGVGYDINCGVRLLASDLRREEVLPKARELVNVLYDNVPTGVGVGGDLRLARKELEEVAVRGGGWVMDRGFGRSDDLGFVEENGVIADADPTVVSDRAFKRGATQLGTLGSGNHFLEVGFVSEIYEENAARILGLFEGQVTVIIHSGSRGFGHQICDDYLREMDGAMRRYDIQLPDRQLACAPIRSPEGQRYLGAMRCAINFAFANRQLMAHHTRRAFAEALRKSDSDINLRTVYEVAHNIAKFERHVVGGQESEVCVHRKGATRAFAAGRPEVPGRYRSVGQPVLIPGDMGRYSYVLVGTDGAMAQTFGSTCHGAGRRLSRRKAKRVAGDRHIERELAEKNIVVRGQSRRTIQEEIPEAYKDVAEVVDTCQAAGISLKVAQLRPIGCIKG
jgi:tRNA-splicing ligase RtcB